VTSSARDFRSSKLASDDTGHVKSGVSITEETLGVCFDLCEFEAVTLVKTSRGVDDARDKGAFHATLAEAGDLGVVADGKRVRECDSGWARRSLSSLVDVSSSQGRRLVVASDAEEGDVL
jgi:hypothetical protein